MSKDAFARMSDSNQTAVFISNKLKVNNLCNRTKVNREKTMAILTLVFGREILDTYDIDREKMIIGRGDDADVVIANLAVSRHHAAVEKKDGLFTVSDLGSNNGTYVNGRLISGPTTLSFGDEIGIGKHVLVFNSHTRKGKPGADTPVYEARASRDAPEMGTMFVEPEKMEKIREKATAARKAHLKPVNGSESKIIPIEKTDIMFGKGDECDIKIKGFFASRRHAILSRMQKGYHLTNFASFSPTKVNGIRVDSALLCDNDEITMGKTTFIFHSEQ
jgi:pSer/pThr/pTyr-binding forkhead associated (FHA) protein